MGPVAGCGDPSTPGLTATAGETSGETSTETTTETTTDTTREPQEGSFAILTYNVAGLPQGISGSNPEVNIPLISPLLNQYPLVVVQEDFYYHEELYAAAAHPYKTERSGDGVNNLGDGLNHLSDFPLGPLTRTAWEACHGTLSNGSDCLANKGFAVTEITLAPGVTVDLYNLHMDAGNGAEDVAARAAQIEQLLAAIAARSGEQAVLVAGDTNIKAGEDANLTRLLGGAGLTDSCQATACAELTLIDRVLYRSSGELSLEATSWALDPTFVDGDGEPLSDHDAVAVTFSWVALGA